MIYFSLIVCVVITIAAPLIIKVMYGEQYLNSVSVLRLLTWHTVFVYIGAVRNIWILAEGKQQYIWVINLGGALANIILNLLLIPSMGAMGAAVATLVTHFINHIVTGLIIKPLWRNNTLLLNGLNPKNLKGVFTALKSKTDGEDNG
jgi:O-antigen/teichoic acid export membrane protein